MIYRGDHMVLQRLAVPCSVGFCQDRDLSASAELK